MNNKVLYISQFITKAISIEKAREILALIFPERADDVKHLKYIQLYSDNVIRAAFESDDPYLDRRTKNVFKSDATIFDICRMSVIAIENT